jgi:hypothetical protein
MKSSATVAILTLVSAFAPTAQAAIYRCVDAQGVVYQDYPCSSSHPANAVAHTPAGRSAARAKTPSLSEWVAKAEGDSRKREAEAKVRALEQQGKQTEAEFAVMMEELDAKKKDAAEARADTPPAWALDQQAAQAKQEYAVKVRENKADLKEAREALEASP